MSVKAIPNDKIRDIAAERQKAGASPQVANDVNHTSAELDGLEEEKIALEAHDRSIDQALERQRSQEQSRKAPEQEQDMDLDITR